MDPITATIAVAQLLNAGLNVFTEAQGKAADPRIGELIGAGVTLLTQAQQVSGLIVKAHQEGREISDAELDALVGDDDRAREAMLAARLAATGGAAKPDAPGT